MLLAADALAVAGLESTAEDAAFFSVLATVFFTLFSSASDLLPAADLLFAAVFGALLAFVAVFSTALGAAPFTADASSADSGFVSVLLEAATDLRAALLPALGLLALGAGVSAEREELEEILEAGEDRDEVFSACPAVASAAVALFPRAETRVLGLDVFWPDSPEFGVSVTGVSWSLVMNVLSMRGGLPPRKISAACCYS
ncbi:hypothetical protein V6C16_11850 [Desulfovibrio sp. 1188_IL3213]|uniref:hypothetical protein n=1 Tax=Desulfovibrio sp. 1188_IL3213 TaxID=3084052 RepID=UPI002FD97162